MSQLDVHVHHRLLLICHLACCGGTLTCRERDLKATNGSQYDVDDCGYNYQRCLFVVYVDKALGLNIRRSSISLGIFS